MPISVNIIAPGRDRGTAMKPTLCEKLLLLAMLVAAPFSQSTAATAPTFGPSVYTRTAGPSQTFTEVFPRCAGSPCQLVVLNGDVNGRNRSGSAEIYLNGKQIVGPTNLNQRVAKVIVPVALEDNDEIKVVLNSVPGSQLTISVDCAAFVALRIENSPGVASSIWSDGTVSLSIPLANDGNVTADNVFITNMSAGAGSYAGPTPFAYAAGTLQPDKLQQIYAQFSNLNGAAAFPLTVSGTYQFGASVCSFQTQASVNPPPAGNGGTPKVTTTVQSFTDSTAVYPPAPPPPEADAQTNAENVYLPPLGQPRYLFPAPPVSSSLDRTRAFIPDDQAPAPGGSSAVSFVRNQKGGNYSSYPPDPSAAGADPSGFVLISANNSSGANDGAVSYSKDFGQTFTTVNLTKGSGFTDPSKPSRTDFFPESDGGLCCDQVVHYVPGRNLMIWLLQYWSPAINVGGLAQKGQNRLRIAYATPQAAAADFLHAWRWFDVSPASLGDATVTDWMDYPDLAYSNGFLYISVDHGIWNAGKDAAGNVIGQQVSSDRRWMVRASLDDMANASATIDLISYEPIKGGLVKAHFAQSAPDTMYYAAQPNTSTLSVFADPDSSSDVPTPKDIPVTSTCQNVATNPCDYSVIAPDNLDWNVAPHGVLGGTFVAPSFLCPPSGCVGPTRFLYFAYDGGRDNSAGRPFPYVRVEKIDADALNLVSELDIWNPGFAFATPALVWRAGSGKDEVAISLATGGGASYADNAVGFLGDFLAYVTTSSNATQSDGASNVRYGDYFSVRNATGPVTPYGQGLGFSTLGYAVTGVTVGKTCALGGCNIALQYVMFGRNEDLFPSPPDPGPR
jgi:hypothetical protein